jgi:hypothetical protein
MTMTGQRTGSWMCPARVPSSSWPCRCSCMPSLFPGNSCMHFWWHITTYSSWHPDCHLPVWCCLQLPVLPGLPAEDPQGAV